MSNRGKYVFKACDACRHKKRKCDGQMPICGSCAQSNVDNCTYRSQRNKLQLRVEELESTIKKLKSYIQQLETTQRHSVEEPTEDSHSTQDWQSTLHTSSSSSNHLSLGFETSSDFEDLFTDEGTQESFSPEKYLTSFQVDGEPQFYGPTSVLRFVPKVPPQPVQVFDDSISYVLFSEGENDSQFDWSRHLPREILIPRPEHDKILSLVFKFVTSCYLEVVPALFLRDMHKSLSVSSSRPPPKTAHYSPMLHNALLALGAIFSDDSRLRDSRSVKVLARKAKSYIEMDSEAQTPSISLLQALSVLGNVHWSQGDYDLASRYFGMSLRVHQDLGLHLDCTPWVISGDISDQDQVDRNWASWSTLCQDVCWSLFVGRGCTVTTASKSPMVPTTITANDLAYNLRNSLPQGTFLQSEFPSMIFAETCRLLMIGKRIVDVLNGPALGGDGLSIDATISEIDVQLIVWKECLPQALTLVPIPNDVLPRYLMLQLTYHWLSVILHRDFCESPKGSANHQRLCYKSATQIISLVQIWRSKFSLHCVPVTLVQIVFSAGTVFIAQIQRDAALSGNEEGSINQVGLCVQYLSEMGKSFPFANHISNLLLNSAPEHRANVQAMALQPPVAEQALGISFHPQSGLHEHFALSTENPWPSSNLGHLRTEHRDQASSQYEDESGYGAGPWAQMRPFGLSMFDTPVGLSPHYSSQNSGLPEAHFSSRMYNLQPREVPAKSSKSPRFVKSVANSDNKDGTKTKGVLSNAPTKGEENEAEDQNEHAFDSGNVRSNCGHDNEFVLVASDVVRNSDDLVTSNAADVVDDLADAMGQILLNEGAESNVEDNRPPRPIEPEHMQQSVSVPTGQVSSVERKLKQESADMTELELLYNAYCGLAPDEHWDFPTKLDKTPKNETTSA